MLKKILPVALSLAFALPAQAMVDLNANTIRKAVDWGYLNKGKAKHLVVPYRISKDPMRLVILQTPYFQLARDSMIAADKKKKKNYPTVSAVRAQYPSLTFLGEVYGDSPTFYNTTRASLVVDGKPIPAIEVEGPDRATVVKDPEKVGGRLFSARIVVRFNLNDIPRNKTMTLRLDGDESRSYDIDLANFQ